MTNQGECRPSSSKYSVCFILIILFLSIVASYPAFHENLFRTHEMESLPIRVFEMRQALEDGHFPVRWVANIPHLYGSPFYNFYAPLVYYIAALIYMTGINLLLSIQLTILLGFSLSGLTMYFFVKDIYGSKAGLVSAVSYMFVPYHLVDIYARGSLSEFFCFSLIPLILLFLRRFFYTKKYRFFILCALSYAAIVLTHNITALFFSFFCFLYIVFLSSQKKDVLFFVTSMLALLLGLGLSCFFWLPALAEKGVTNTDVMTLGYLNLKNHFVYFHQFFDPSFEFGSSLPGPDDEMPFQLGLTQTILFPIALIFLFCSNKYKENIKRNNLLLFSGLTALTLFLMTEGSYPIWSNLPLVKFIQFPWRLLIFPAFFMSIIAGSVFTSSDSQMNVSANKSKINSLLLTGTIVFMLAIPFSWAIGGIQYTLVDNKNTSYKLFPEDINKQTLQNEFWRISTIGTTYGEYLPKGLEGSVLWDLLYRTGHRVASVNGQDKIEGVTKKTGQITFQMNKQEDAQVLVDIIYFPGWQVYIDGIKSKFNLQNYLISFTVPKGPHQVEVLFENTPIRSLANTISLISIAAAILLLLLLQFFSHTLRV